MILYSRLSVQAAGMKVQTPFLASVPAAAVDLEKDLVTLPVYTGSLAGEDNVKIYYIVTDASTEAAAKAWGVNVAPPLAALKGSSGLVQSAGGQPSYSPDNAGITFTATVDFLYGKRAVVPDPETGFPPLAFNYSAKALPGM